MHHEDLRVERNKTDQRNLDLVEFGRSNDASRTQVKLLAPRVIEVTVLDLNNKMISQNCVITGKQKVVTRLKEKERW